MEGSIKVSVSIPIHLATFNEKHFFIFWLGLERRKQISHLKVSKNFIISIHKNTEVLKMTTSIKRVYKPVKDKINKHNFYEMKVVKSIF